MRVISKKPIRDFWERHPESKSALEEWFRKASQLEASSFPDLLWTFGSADYVAHIESEADYAQATALLNNLLDIVRDDASHPLYSLVSVVGDLIEAYEIDHEPF